MTTLEIAPVIARRGLEVPVRGAAPLPSANRVIHWETHRGRNNEFDKTEAGTATITLKNRDGLFDPFNAASVYTDSDNLLPLRQLRITVNTPAHPATWHDIFTGYIEEWNFERRGPRHALATVEITDGFELLNNSEIYITQNNPRGGHYFATLHVDDRIRAALGFAGWPSARQSIFSGNVDVQDQNYDPGTSMLAVIQEAVDAEFPGLANFYMDRSGNACFRGRYYRMDPFSSEWDNAENRSRSAMLWKFGDDYSLETYSDSAEFPDVGHLIPMANLQWSFTKERLYTVVQVTPAGLDERLFWKQTFSDDVQIEKYGRRDLTITGLLVDSGDANQMSTTSRVQTRAEECQRFAQYYLTSYKFPHVRANQLEVHSKFEDDDVWHFLVNVEIGDVVELYTHHPGGGGFFGEQFFVDGIHNVVDAVGDWPQWVSTFDLTPRGYWGFYPEPFDAE